MPRWLLRTYDFVNVSFLLMGLDVRNPQMSQLDLLLPRLIILGVYFPATWTCTSFAEHQRGRGVRQAYSDTWRCLVHQEPLVVTHKARVLNSMQNQRGILIAKSLIVWFYLALFRLLDRTWFKKVAVVPLTLFNPCLAQKNVTWRHWQCASHFAYLTSCDFLLE